MKGLLIATKAGLTRPWPDQWTPSACPAYLIAQAKGSLRKLGVEQIDRWQLHRIDPRVPRDEQFGAVRQLLDDGIIRHAGLSEVSVADIEAARRVFPLATVQNRYNLVDRGSEDVPENSESDAAFAGQAVTGPRSFTHEPDELLGDGAGGFFGHIVPTASKHGTPHIRRD